MKPQTRTSDQPGDQLIERLTHINQFLERIYGEPLRLSDLLLRSGISSKDIDSIKKLHVEPVVDAICHDMIVYLHEVLPPKHVKVVAERFCLSGPDQPTLQEVADELSLSRERIRQLQDAGIRRLGGRTRRNGARL